MYREQLQALFERAKSEYGIQQIPGEFLDFMEFCREQDIQSVIEIGSYTGGTTFMFREAFEKRVIAVDINPLSDIKGVEYISGDSQQEDTIKAVNTLLGQSKVDMLFVDGNHSYEGVKADWENYCKRVKKGGLIVFHDIVDSQEHRIQGCNVAQLWDTLKKSSDAKEFITDGSTWGGIGVIVKAS